jgi:alpha-beta hydrolase superfamily lysophospholipase
LFLNKKQDADYARKVIKELSLVFRGLSLRGFSYSRKARRWTLESFADLFEDFRNLKHKIRELDPSMESGMKIPRELVQEFAP